MEERRNSERKEKAGTKDGVKRADREGKLERRTRLKKGKMNREKERGVKRER